jgi:hypothetical protein
MTVKQLRNKLNDMMNEIPNTANDEISYFNEDKTELNSIEDVDIVFDIESIGRYIVIK